MTPSDIVIKGAREHNLCDVSLVLPRNQLVCMTGVSGSGKSSLAFDTLYAEGQRRYVESLSSFARQFLGQMPKPDVDFIGGLSPSISISQKTAGNNPRSTVGTITEIYDYLRVLYARVGTGFCPECGKTITAQTRDEIIERILQLPPKTHFAILAPIVRGQKGEYRDLFVDLLKQGFVRARVDRNVVSLNDDLQLDRRMRHDIEVIVDRLEIKKNIRSRVAESVELAMKLGQGNLIVALEASPAEKSTSKTKQQRTLPVDGALLSGQAHSRGKRSGHSGSDDIVLSANYACTACGVSFEPPTPQMFSFNSPQGMCFECDGLGRMFSFDPELLVPKDKWSFKQGCVETVGRWSSLGRWKRHIYQGVSDTIERIEQLPPGTMLETPWDELDQSLRDKWLWGTEEIHITFTWRGGERPQKYGGTWEGVIPELLSKYRNTKSNTHLRQMEKYMSTIVCPDCHGERLNPQARSVKLCSTHPQFAKSSWRTLPEVCDLSIADAGLFFQQLKLEDTGAIIAAEALKEICGRLGFLMNVGLNYLTLSRTAPTLSGGETQRIRLAGQVGCGLVGVLYILDEPSIGLHPRDNQQLLDTLGQLRDMGNTVLVVEHDEDTMWAADHMVDFGPGAGVRGGHVVAEGSAADVMQSKRSVTGKYLSGTLAIDIPQERRDPGGHFLKIIGATHNNLKNIDVEIPLGLLVCVTGVSGSGKSSLANDILGKVLHRDLNGGKAEPGAHQSVEGLENLDKLIAIDQSPIGRTPRSNPGTYIKVFDDIRNLFAQLPEAKRRGYKPGRFSFNVKGGRCEACEGNGSTRLEMDFLADVWVECPVCEGHRFNHETLQVRFKEKSIADVLEMDIQQLLGLFENVPKVFQKLQTLHDVGLDYLKLGQPSPTLSGGEAQRIKLARELVKRSTGRTLYLLDEPTTGLHFADVKLLLKVLHGFVTAGNTVVVVEHNLDVIKTADWVIDLGPEGGEAGGQVIIQGTPEKIVAGDNGRAKQGEFISHTAVALYEILQRKSSRHRKRLEHADHPSKRRNRSGKPSDKSMQKITVRGAQQHNLKYVDVEIQRDTMTTFCGPSGSGKTSLAMDTIYAEGQRRYVESLSAYARQFVSQMQKPKLEHIDGLSPAIAIEQRNLGHTPRSTVGTVTEIYDYLRILMARLGTPHCPDCEIPVGTQSSDEVIDKVLAIAEGTKLYLLAPVEVDAGHQYTALWDALRTSGYVRIRVDGQTYSLDDPPAIDRRRRHEVDVLVDRIVVRKKSRGRIAESIEAALALGKGILRLAFVDETILEERWNVETHSQHLACDHCGRSFDRLLPHNFSFNSQLGWCGACEGLGTQIGANPTALLNDSRLSLRDGALHVWPSLQKNESHWMLEAIARKTGIDLDMPFEQLGPRHRRLIMHGTGEEWFEVYAEKTTTAKKRKRKNAKETISTKDKRAQTQRTPLFRFQFKGLYPALDEASRVSPALRAKLDHLVDEVPCTTCDGSRLRDDAAAVRFHNRMIADYCRIPLGELQQAINSWKMNARERKIAGEIVREVKNRLQFLCDVGLEYITLSRPAATLSGGEFQRIRLASQLGSGLCGVLYVLDEPTIGLHPRDNRRLLSALHKLRDLGNTLIVVEHDRDVISESDAICDFGPAAGKHGGQIVAHGTPDQIRRRRGSVTGPYLSGKKSILVPTNRRMSSIDPLAVTSATKPIQEATGRSSRASSRKKQDLLGKNNRPQTEWLEIIGACHNNLQNIDVRFPLATLTAITGVSGSGKSSLIDDILFNSLARRLHRAKLTPGLHKEIRGTEHINKVIRVDQQALGNSPSSNPATYTGVFETIRQLFGQLPEAKLRGYTPRRFSFNVSGGRCDACDGNGQVCIEMHFLPDVWVECDTCRGQRYNPETLSVLYRGRNIFDVLKMPCGEALKLFENIPKIRRILQTLCDVGLDYLSLGQAAPTLSGGEAQRVKLAAELSRPDTGRTLYLLDEPTTGLHFEDLQKLLDVMHRLVDLGNTVVVVEHNLDIIKSADWVIDIGPEAGEQGGLVVASGTPEDIVAQASRVAKQMSRRKSTSSKRSRKQSEYLSLTGAVLADVLRAGPYAERKPFDFVRADVERAGDLEISDVGNEQKMPWEVNGRRWHTEKCVGRDGKRCRWDGRILERVVDRIHELGEFRSTDWNSRSVVEIAAARKKDGWLFHALTGESWLLKMKFRVQKNTFRRDTLQADLQLKSLNEIEELPIYGNEPRVQCKNLRGPWQEVQIQAHSLEEMDKPEFWHFIEQAVKGFQRWTDRAAEKPEDVMPWKKLGQRWHWSRKGFPPGKRVQWELDLLEQLCEILHETAPDGQFLWGNQQVVHLVVPGQREPWASVFTKRLASVDLALTGPKGRHALGQIADLGRTAELDTSPENRDVIKLRFQSVDDLQHTKFSNFLAEHLSSLQA